MKQHITKAQWMELTQEQQKIWDEFIDNSEEGGDYSGVGTPFPMIGQMIEFIIRHRKMHFSMWHNYSKAKDDYGWQIENIYNQQPCHMEHRFELCDALWEAVKYILNNENEQEINS